MSDQCCIAVLHSIRNVTLGWNGLTNLPLGVTTEWITSTTKEIKIGPNHSSMTTFVTLHGMLWVS